MTQELNEYNMCGLWLHVKKLFEANAIPYSINSIFNNIADIKEEVEQSKIFNYDEHSEIPQNSIQCLYYGGAQSTFARNFIHKRLDVAIGALGGQDQNGMFDSKYDKNFELQMGRIVSASIADIYFALGSGYLEKFKFQFLNPLHSDLI